MNKFLSAITITLSTIALAASGWTIARLSQLQSSIEQQQNSIIKQQDTITQLANQIAKNQVRLSSSISQQTNLIANTSEEQNTTIQPGQFVRQGVDNKIKIELLSVKRIQNPDSDLKDVVVVQMRIRRIVPQGKVDSISFSQSKGRNPETSEVYRTITNKSTNFTYINNLPENSWGNAYFWLKVPQEVDAIDIIIPKTAIFEKAPISN